MEQFCGQGAKEQSICWRQKLALEHKKLALSGEKAIPGYLESCSLKSQDSRVLLEEIS
jgi:hypothetical protein